MRYPVPAHTLDRQKRASDPRVSAWVSANAGSGKTHVLTQRVVRLLLDGVSPSRLVCLTFTKAAAANMSARVFRTLADWTLADDSTLRARIRETGAEPPENLDQARALFAAAVETPGGLKVQTIHAFCERVLHLFPFEANVPAEFRAAEDIERAELLAQALRETLAAAADDAALGAALTLVADTASQDGFEKILQAAMAKREALADAEAWIARLPQALGLSPGDGEISIGRAMIEDGVHWSEWPAIADAFAQGSKTDRARGEQLREAAARAPDPCCIAGYLEFFFTEGGEGGKRKRMGAKAIAPDLLARLDLEASRLAVLRDKRRALATLDRSAALLRLAAACLEHYEALKRARGVLDFDDMIEKTRALLTRDGAAAWALYKLDNGVDHILVDEAQDTSKAQWTILEALAAEFTAGAGARPQRRTFFAVGDEKQSIFSFQGASPQSFGEMRTLFGRRVADAGLVFDPVSLELSFRSARTILDAVDHIFGQAAALRGLQADPSEPPPTHMALKHDLPGMVEVWEPIVGAAVQDPKEWTLPVDLPRETSPPVELARLIARKIGGFIAPASRERVHDSEGGPRPIRPGDVMILVRRRDAFFEAMVRALKAEGVPVAGADRLDIAGHIAVEDLLAAARAALAPDDDYSLACALKSPLCDLDDDDLIELAPGRGGSLVAALSASSRPRHMRAAARIAGWRAHAGGMRPFDFFSRLLGPEGGRRAILARLGAEAGDALDEFMALALEHERSEAPSLAAFIHEVEGLDQTIKRDMDEADDLVRVMTAHAAKGLEAKIVFLPDTCRLPPSGSDKALFELHTDLGATLAWSPRKDDDPAAVAACRQDARDEVENEYRRLLYVALTRAEERLYICGHHGARRRQSGCWLDLVVAGLDPYLTPVADDGAPGGVVRRFGVLALGDEHRRLAAHVADDAPAWLFTEAAIEKEPAPPVRPSSALSGADIPETTGDASPAGDGNALQRGVLIHQLMQSLPALAAQERAAAAALYLRTRAHGAAPAVIEAMADEAVAAIALAEAGPLFAATSRAEVTIAAPVAREGKPPIPIAGRIDRLAEVGGEIWFADFKTGRPPDHVPPTYVAQLALYRAALGEIYPGRNVRAFILWTQAPRLDEVCADAMHAALAAI